MNSITDFRSLVMEIQRIHESADMPVGGDAPDVEGASTDGGPNVSGDLGGSDSDTSVNETVVDNLRTLVEAVQNVGGELGQGEDPIASGEAASQADPDGDTGVEDGVSPSPSAEASSAA